MLTKTEFFKKYKGKKVEFDGVAPYQCVDYVKQYLKDCFGITAGSWGDAKYYYLNFYNTKWGGYTVMNKYFELIPNTPTFIPRRGDIGVFNGVHGHICVCTGEGNTKEFYSYDQNYSGKYVTYEKHRYTDFIGVLRPLYGTVTTALNVRTGAGTGYKITGELTPGTLVDITHPVNGWYQIGKNKFISRNYID